MKKNIKISIFLLTVLLINCKNEKVNTDPNVEKWKNLSINLIEATIKNDTVPETIVNTYSSLTHAIAIIKGWDNNESKKYLNKTYDIIDSLGYGLGYEWDAFQDGTVNSKYTNYTVTMADHVGFTFVAGYKAGIIPRRRLTHLLESINKIPYADNLINGKCLAYSDSKNDIIGCVHNVNIGVAYIFQEMKNIGLVSNELDGKIKDIIDREIDSYLIDKNSYLYWDKSPNLSDQNHLAYQAWCLIQLPNSRTKQIGISLINGISADKKKDISSLVGQLRILPYEDSDAEYLYSIVKKLLENQKTEYSPIGVYNINNPRILAQLSLWVAKYYEYLKNK
ncbi:hypothetical protein [Emticicia sp. BO119]|uniref:hypothetical protein n=1 Tax=Emticicia sp. BO119 TaxID=2757768 RepID=UPI0015F03D42|nr:hypothetical protein [Emticicia sp. BO119]MBA4849507.1 hypothetical protein [Emticicia sp. BO119]